MSAPFEPGADDFRQVWAAFNGYGGLVARPHSATMDEGYAEFDRWLAGVKADAWEAGYEAGDSDRYWDKGATRNPYRDEDAA